MTHGDRVRRCGLLACIFSVAGKDHMTHGDRVRRCGLITSMQ